MQRITSIAALFLSLLALGACGSTTSDRTLSGGGIGAGVGAATGALLGSPVKGALLGGAIGARSRCAHQKENQVDLGKPIWK